MSTSTEHAPQGRTPATTTCPLCDTVQAISRCEWWTDTTPLGDLCDTPRLVCRDVVGCTTRARRFLERIGSPAAEW